ncbi:MAG: glycosyltransferase [Chitinophagaceae bacterium]|nr:MAG: glycosyltransferase [Chitinophagaceae bacterium]
MSQILHIVCLDAPSPPDYGGAIDMHYKVKALAETGKKIILHYFDYNAKRGTDGLEKFCTAIYSYQRKPIYRSLLLSQPFIVQSRINENLIKRLNQDNEPILLEGLHCSGIIPFLNDPKRVVLRMHNEEGSYYHYLAQSEPSFLKKKYLIQESKFLKRYQHKLDKQIKLACLSQFDMEAFNTDDQFQNLHFLPCFIPWQQLTNKEGSGDYCLYHGNMSVSENEEAALWLLKNVFSRVEVPLIIAGKRVSNRLVKIALQHKNVSIINNPTVVQLDELIQNAQINVLPSMNNTGVKLKLLNALLNGRYCITNINGVKGAGINAGLFVEDDPAEWITLIEKTFHQTFTPNEMLSRQEILDIYDNQKNAIKLNALW